MDITSLHLEDSYEHISTEVVARAVRMMSNLKDFTLHKSTSNDLLRALSQIHGLLTVRVHSSVNDPHRYRCAGSGRGMSIAQSRGV